MSVLLDTHAWLWFVLGDPQLSRTARDTIEDVANGLLVSPASYWETAIKISTGKYALPEPYPQFVARAVDGQGFTVLPVLPRHTAVLCTLPFHHRDPFDRLMVAQALADDLSIVSVDGVFDAYGVRRIW